MPSSSNSHSGALLSPNRASRSHLPQALEPDDVSICDECKQVDWSAVPALAAKGLIRSDINCPTSYRTLRPVNETFEQLRSSACKICRILSTIRPGSIFERCFLKTMPISDALPVGNNQNLSESTVLVILPEAVEGSRLCSGVHNVLGISKPGGEKYDLEAREIVASSIEFSFLRDMVRYCGNEHRCCKREASSLDNVSGLKVIDVTTRTIIQAPENCEYIALSYVWGTGTYGSSSRDDLKRPPRIIEDAMSVTSTLGYSYLWIDKYVRPLDSPTGSLKIYPVYAISTLTRCPVHPAEPLYTGATGKKGANDQPDGSYLCECLHYYYRRCGKWRRDRSSRGVQHSPSTETSQLSRRQHLRDAWGAVSPGIPRFNAQQMGLKSLDISRRLFFIKTTGFHAKTSHVPLQ